MTLSSDGTAKSKDGIWPVTSGVRLGSGVTDYSQLIQEKETIRNITDLVFIKNQTTGENLKGIYTKEDHQVMQNVSDRINTGLLYLSEKMFVSDS
jgi:hypothetical protein